MDNLSVDFYDETHASVSIALPSGLETPADLLAGPFLELLLFAGFTIRQLCNLGGHVAAQSLASHLDSGLAANPK